MKRFQFKGLTVKGKEWVTGDLSTLHTEPHIIYKKSGNIISEPVFEDTISPAIGQYAAGLKEVFLGDVLRDPEHHKEFEVVWVDEQSSFALHEVGSYNVHNICDFLSNGGEILLLEVVGRFVA